MAMMEEWINYVSPVPAARDVILADANAAQEPADAAYLKNVANSPLVSPSEADAAKLHDYPSLSEEQDTQWLSIWQPVSQS